MLSPSGNKFPTIRAQIALALAKRGWKIFPLISGGKTPAIADWPRKATTDSATILKWFSERGYNIGILCGLIGEGPDKGLFLVVIDYDMKPGQKGDEALRWHEFLGIADTFTVKTPNGIHKYVLARINIANSQSRIAPNVDTRGHHGYVVGPLSVIEGVTYEVLDERMDLAAFPAEFEQLIAAKDSVKTTNSHRKAPLGELDRPDTIERAKRYLEHDAPEAVEGSHGDLTTYQVASFIKDMGVSEGQCLELMLEHWNDRKAIPPWPFDALRTKVSNAYAYGQNPPGVTDPLVEFPVEPIVGTSGQQDPTKTRQGLYRVNYRNRVKNAGKSHGEPLIKGLFKRGTLAVMYGPSNSGKTFIAMDMSYAIGGGILWNGMPTTKGLVVYIAAEGGPGVNDRTAALDLRRKPASDPLFDVVPCPIDLLRGNGPDSHTALLLALIRDAEREHGTPCSLIVIDTLSRALAGGEENSSVDMGMFIKHVDQLRAATGAAVLVIHHSGKDIARGGRGWSGIQAAIDTEIEINQGVFSVTKQRDLKTIDDLRFVLEPVQVCTDKDGDAISSCVLIWGAEADFQTEPTPPEAKLLGLIEAYMETEKTDEVGPKGLVEFSDRDLDRLSQRERQQRYHAMLMRLRRLAQGGHLIDAGRGKWKFPLTTPNKPHKFQM